MILIGLGNFIFTKSVLFERNTLKLNASPEFLGMNGIRPKSRICYKILLSL